MLLEGKFKKIKVKIFKFHDLYELFLPLFLSFKDLKFLT